MINQNGLSPYTTHIYQVADPQPNSPLLNLPNEIIDLIVEHSDMVTQSLWSGTSKQLNELVKGRRMQGILDFAGRTLSAQVVAKQLKIIGMGAPHKYRYICLSSTDTFGTPEYVKIFRHICANPYNTIRKILVPYKQLDMCDHVHTHICAHRYIKQLKQLKCTLEIIHDPRSIHTSAITEYLSMMKMCTHQISNCRQSILDFKSHIADLGEPEAHFVQDMEVHIQIVQNTIHSTFKNLENVNTIILDIHDTAQRYCEGLPFFAYINLNVLTEVFESALKINAVSVIDLLLKCGLDTELHAKRESTFLYKAAAAGNIEIVRLLLKYGANIRAVDELGNTCLHAAVSSGNSEVVMQLINGGAPINAMSNYGTKTALYLAVFEAKIELVALLLDLGADTDISDNRANTPLHIAVYKGYNDIASLLLCKGANNTLLNNAGLTSLQIAENFKIQLL